MGQPVITILENFLGLRENNSGDLTLRQGELAKCTNCRITDNYKIEKRDGYSELTETGLGGQVQGLWYGRVAGTEKLLMARDGHIYDVNISTGVATSIGTLTDEVTSFFGFADKVYIQNKNEYKVWTGTGSISDVTGYTPLVAIATPPAGGGTPFEEINILTGQKKQSFSGDATATIYQLAETNIDSVEEVTVDGVVQTVTTDYTVNLTNGTITPVPASKFTVGTDNIVITWTKGSGTRATVTGNNYNILYGGKNDTRVFMYGVDNKLIYSELADGLPSAEYFPESNSILVGSDNYDIKGLTKQYERLIIHKENETYYASYTQTDEIGTIFSVFPINDSIGNVAAGQTRTILNDPFTVTNNGIYRLGGTNVRDEKNAILVSERVQLGLDALDLTNAITYDYERNFEYIIGVGSTLYLYNYKVDVWYKYILTDTPTYYIEIDGDLYFGTDAGEIMKFASTDFTDNGTIFSAEWETGYLNYGVDWQRKFLTYGWVTLKPDSKASVLIDWETDRGASVVSYECRHNNFDFGNVDFEDFTFNTNLSPRPFRKKFKAKKFSSLKMKGKNETDTDSMTILGITLPALTGGQVKGR